MIFTLFAMSSLVSAKLIFKESFDEPNWTDRWTQSTAKGDDAGSLGLTAGKWYGDSANVGLQTKDDAKFYQVSTKFDEAFDNKDKNLVVQYSVKHEQLIDCGGAYLKLFGADVAKDLTTLTVTLSTTLCLGPTFV